MVTSNSEKSFDEILIALYESKKEINDSNFFQTNSIHSETPGAWGDGMGELYYYSDDGYYLWNKSNYAYDEREVAKAGLWKIENGRLKLNELYTMYLDGGHFEEIIGNGGEVIKDLVDYKIVIKESDRIIDMKIENKGLSDYAKDIYGETKDDTYLLGDNKLWYSGTGAYIADMYWINYYYTNEIVNKDVEVVELDNKKEDKPQSGNGETSNDVAIDYMKELENFKNIFCERLNSVNDKNMSMDDLKIGKEISIDELKVEYPTAYEVFDEMVLSHQLIEESFIEKCLIADVDNDEIEDIQICYTDSGLGISARSVYNDILFGCENGEFVYKESEEEIGNYIGTWGSTSYCLKHNGVNYEVIYDGYQYSKISVYSHGKKIGYKRISQKLINDGVFVEYNKADSFAEIINRNMEIMNKENFEKDKVWLDVIGTAETLESEGFWGAWYMTKKIACDVDNNGIKEEYTKYIPARGDTLAQITPNQIEGIFDKYEINERASFWVEKDKLNENVICVFNIYYDNFVLNGYKIKNETCEQVFSIKKNIIRKYE